MTPFSTLENELFVRSSIGGIRHVGAHAGDQRVEAYLDGLRRRPARPHAAGPGTDFFFLAVAFSTIAWLWNPESCLPRPVYVLIAFAASVSRRTGMRARPRPSSIDWLPRRALFENATTTERWTLPAHASLFTGL